MSQSSPVQSDRADERRAVPGRARLLFVGDIHLGRKPTRLPEDLSEHGLDPAALTPAAAWSGTVELARDLAGEPEGLAAVVLAGDVVESLEDRFGAYPHLERGVVRIVEAGVRVYGVAGNHDVQALPRLADRIEGFHLLGRAGQWERVSPCEGVDLVGWSFPERRVRESPLTRFAFEPTMGRVTLGVLHCDLDGGQSPYAPVARAELERAASDAWLLGHVHAPSALDGDRPIGYLGSLVGLDPGEPGPHGPWLVTVDERRRVAAEHVPLAPLRWERETLALDDAMLAARGEDAESLRDALYDAGKAALSRVAERLERAPRCPRVAGVRLIVEGATRHRSAVRAWRQSREGWPTLSRRGLHLFTEKIEDHSRPAIDLEALARGSDPPALLARRLRAVEAGEPEAMAALERLDQRLAAIRNDARWSGLEGDDGRSARGGARERLLRTGLEALEDLLEQRSDPEVLS